MFKHDTYESMQEQRHVVTWLQPKALAAPLSLNLVVPVSAFKANPFSRPKMQVILSHRKLVRSLKTKQISFQRERQIVILDISLTKRFRLQMDITVKRLDNLTQFFFQLFLSRGTPNGLFKCLASPLDNK